MPHSLEITDSEKWLLINALGDHKTRLERFGSQAGPSTTGQDLIATENMLRKILRVGRRMTVAPTPQDETGPSPVPTHATMGG